MDITPTIEIYFSSNKDNSKAYTVYNIENNDEQIQICPFIFYDIQGIYDNNDDNITCFIPLEILQNRFEYMKTKVELPEHIHHKIDTMLKSIEKKKEIYYGIRVIF